MNRWIGVSVGIFVAASPLAAAPAGGPVTLAQAAREAAANAAGARSAAAQESASQARRRLAADAFHPELSVSTTPGYASGLPVAVAGQVPAVAAASLTALLYDPAASAAIRQAGGEAALAQGQSEVARREAVRRALTLYAAAWADRKIARASREQEAALAEIASHVRGRQEAGRATPAEADRARLEAARARASAAAAEADASLDATDLREALGWAPGERPTPAQDPFAAGVFPAPGTGAQEAALNADPVLSSLNRAADAARRALAIRRRWPPATMAGEAQYARLAAWQNYDRYYRRFKADDWSVGVSISIPLWTGGRTPDERARLSAELASLSEQARGRRDEVETTLRRALAEAEQREVEASLSREASAVASEDLAAALALSREGRGDPDGPDRARAALALARRREVEAELGLFRARLDLDLVTGGWAGALARDPRGSGGRPSDGRPSP